MFLIESVRFNPNLKDSNGYTPIMWAHIRGQAEIQQYLLLKGANMDDLKKLANDCFFFIKEMRDFYNHKTIQSDKPVPQLTSPPTVTESVNFNDKLTYSSVLSCYERVYKFIFPYLCNYSNPVWQQSVEVIFDDNTKSISSAERCNWYAILAIGAQLYGNKEHANLLSAKLEMKLKKYLIKITMLHSVL